jgi:DNA-3-methyladenine glycosylase
LICLDTLFYARPTYIVARQLIGKRLVRVFPSTNGKRLKRLSGIIVETEAYGFDDDPASHAYRGPTLRNIIMFGQVGRAYIYFTYGNHFCINVSAKMDRIKAGAVLIRALRPLEGIDVMKKFRKTDDELSLTSGPGKITQAFDIKRGLNGVMMTDPEGELRIEQDEGSQLSDSTTVIETRRIGISQALDKNWRFVMAHVNSNGHYIVSKYASRRNINNILSSWTSRS